MVLGFTDFINFVMDDKKHVSEKLFLLDGMALIYRAYFALSKVPRLTSYGLNTGAIMGFTNTLLELLNKQKPTHIAVVFDTSAPTNRHLEFPEYKAHREKNARRPIGFYPLYL